MRESAFQKQVIKFLKEKDVWHVKYWAGSQYTKEGIPDILACIDGVFHGIELKTDVGVPSKLQLYNIRKINDSGGEAYILRPKGFESWKERWFE
ncbi:VRR-NUC domain-containing protein [Bacillus toyonensis]|uniref:VRR-NUC domain-containing protein n=1 Tax=Bacillus toyonensis TaxID=155322 RepID=UPI0012BA2E89|nr:VRR-NUC domain-containing protein [Bacillus toyonensis]KAB0446747.1 nuclease [Lysinibacillus sp. VIA-II-2016]MBG9610324.1 nuclease [Bacillus toyonensis]MBG9843092.1 nuclease [Bacillus toyonensis]MBG9852230.1 nuclease [Bacillus toyonensis]MBG9852489.1 nuclease [Bacillus toyonensis]